MMAIFFPLFTLLEDFGYLPRVAFNLDNTFRRVGAHGKQALTMAMGWGCNAAGVVAARIIDGKRIAAAVRDEIRKAAVERRTEVSAREMPALGRLKPAERGLIWALMNQPEVLLADEPTSNLDEQTEREVMDMLRAIHASTGVTILMVTHTSQLIPYGTRALEMADGALRNERMTH